MAKSLRQVYAVWVKDEDFDPAYELRGQDEQSENENVVGPKVVKPQKTQISIIDVLRSHGWTGTSKGHQLRGPCPIHLAETTDRSFAVHSVKNQHATP